MLYLWPRLSAFYSGSQVRRLVSILSRTMTTSYGELTAIISICRLFENYTDERS